MKRDAGLDAYLKEAVSWDADRIRRIHASETRAWWVAGASLLVTLALAASLWALMPLKRVEPFVIRVDNATGVVDVVPAYDGQAEPNEAVHRYFLGHYVRLHERFNAASAEQDYYELAAFNSPAMNQEWFALWQKGNPRSPLERYKDGTTVRVEIRSVSFFERGNGVKDLAQVRFGRFTKSGAGGLEAPAYYIASIQFAYTKPSSDVQQRQWNPLGFRVVDLRVDTEVPAEAAKSP